MKRKYGFSITKLYFSAVSDLFILYMFWGILAFLFFSVSMYIVELEIFNRSRSLVKPLFGMISIFSPWFIYFFVIFRKSGQTLAMRLFKLKVLPQSGNKLKLSSTLDWAITLTTPLLILVAAIIVSGPPYAPYMSLIERKSDTKIIET